MTPVDNPRDEFIAPGTRVSIGSLANNDLEYGVVVHCWMSDEIAGHDCYVALFGDSFPTTGRPETRPYILRYAALSLTILPQK